uniref:Uncharacterized protein n=1 Tax=Theropithecus gelada TaxID=9565 RepID=A0A8D2EHK8_THEGE
MATGQKLMRAVRVFEFGRPEVLKQQSDIAVLIPKDHQVLIKVQACGLSHRARPVIGSQYPLEKVAQALETTIHGSGATGKRLFSYDD